MEDMKVRIGNLNDINEVISFYNNIIDHQKDDEYTPMWTKDIYPCLEDIRYHLIHNKVYVVENEKDIIWILVFQVGEDDIYKNGNWSIKEEVGVIHLLAVNPEYRHQAYAKKLLKYVIEENKNIVKTIHLDVMLTNLSANKLYESIGFRFVEKKDVFYEDTGEIQALLYEYII